MSIQLFRNFKLAESDYETVRPDTAFIVRNGILDWIGPQKKIPKNLSPNREIDLKKQLVFPSFIECHTHLVFSGSRAEEFEMRNQGVSYLEIAQRGGGIVSTMRSTRNSTEAQLLELAQFRANGFLIQGVSTLEVKSGYGLDLKSELKCLNVAKKINGPQIVPTFLGPHAKPPEFESTTDYIEYLIESVLPKVKEKDLANRADIFVETKFFERPESEKYLQKAKDLGFDLVLHANQLSLSAGAELALKYGARSADHLIHLNEKLVSEFAKSKTVAVLLPMADLYMKCAYPPARALLDAGATVALATDFNPGSCPSMDLATVGLLARLEMKMTLPEVFRGYTEGAAKALGVFEHQGSITIGKLANFVSTEADLSDFFYSVGKTPEHRLFIRGRQVKI